MKTVSLKFAGCAALLALGLNAGAAISTQEGFNAAVAAAKAGDVIELESNGGSYKIPGIPANITIQSAAGVKFDCTGSGSIASIPNGATFKGGEFSFGNVNYHGFQHAGTIVCEGCTLNGRLSSYGDMIFNSCTFNAPGSSESGISSIDYSMWTYAHAVTYNNCVFNGKGKYVNVYSEKRSEGDGPYVITVNGCTFKNCGDAKKAPILVKEWVDGNNMHFFKVILQGENKLEGNFHEGCYEDEVKFAYGDGLVAVEAEETPSGHVTVWDGTTQVYPEPEAKEIEIEPVTKDESKGITQDVADQINNNTEVKKIVQSGVNDALANIDPEGEAVVKVNLEKVEKAEDEAKTPTLTFKVAPYVGDTEVANVNEKLNGKKVTVVLPLTKDFTISAIVTHEGDPDRLLPVLGLPNSPYVRLETTHFSEFIATPNSQKVSSTEVDAKTVLGIKRVKEMPKSVDTAAAVPWLGAAGGDCKVSDLITTGLAMGDTIKVYDLATKGYFTWVVDKDGKTWVKVSGAPASQPEADQYTLARGRAFWYMKDGGNESVEYTQVGTYSTDQIQTATDKGSSFAAPVHNLLINPMWTAFSIQEKLTVAAGCLVDDVVVIVATGARYRFNGSVWGQDVDTQVKIGRVTVTQKVFKAIGEEGVGGGIVPAGTAFWYLSAGGQPTIKW